MLGRCPDALPASQIGDHSYVAYLRVDDVDAFHQRALDAGADVLKSPTDEPWGRRELSCDVSASAGPSSFTTATR